MDCNPAATELLGYDVAALRGMTAFNIHPEEDRKAVEQALKDLVRCGRVEGEFRMRRRDGTIIWVLLNVSLVGPGHALGYCRDITERKRAEEALRESEQRFRTLSEAAFEAIVIHDKGKILDVNQTFAKMFGYELLEVIGKNVLDLTAPESRDLVLKNILSGYEKPYEVVGLRKDGSTFVQESCGKTLPRGRRTIRVADIRDITERKQAEEALRQSEQKYHILFEESRDAIYITTREGKFVDINNAWLELFGYTKEELADLKVQALWANPDDRPRFQGEIEQKGFARDYEAKLRKKDGTEMDCVLTSTLWRATDGSVIGYQGIIHDITGRKRRDAERQLLLADLRAKNRELESFVYTISHDLKAPLVSLSGFSAALQKEIYSQLSKEGKHYLERIQANVGHMGSLIGSLLELSRIGRVIGAIEEVDVAALLREIWNRLAVTLEKAGVEFRVREPLPTVRADQGRMRQVFANLIDNAIKFRSAERALHIEVGCRQEGSFYRFHVADNGIGIAPQYHEQIFVPFRSLHPEIEGAGMGLAIVKKIVEHHGGRVWVESPSDWLRAGDEGTGATFYFTLPIECGIEPHKEES